MENKCKIIINYHVIPCDSMVLKIKYIFIWFPYYCFFLWEFQKSNDFHVIIVLLF